MTVDELNDPEVRRQTWQQSWEIEEEAWGKFNKLIHETLSLAKKYSSLSAIVEIKKEAGLTAGVSNLAYGFMKLYDAYEHLSKRINADHTGAAERSYL